MGKKILIVDDASSIRSLISMTLKSSGYDVVEAIDGKDGLSKVKAEKVDMIISDLNMPNMNGIEFITEVKKDAALKFIPIVMLTTESEESKKQDGQKAGAMAWIIKPVKPEILLATVKKVVG